MTICLLSVGLVSILVQVILLRELNVAFFGVELIYLLALGIWLFWTAIGAVAGHRRHAPSASGIAVCFLVFGIVVLPDIAFIRFSHVLFGGIPGAYLTFFQQLAVAVIAVFPAGFLSGLLFQWAAKLYVSEGRTLAAAYAIESAGGLIGGLFSTVLIMWGLQNSSAVIICALLSAITPLAFLRGRELPLRLACAVLIIVLLALGWKASTLDRLMTAWTHPNLLTSRDTPYGRITLTRLAGQVSIFENNALVFETEGTEAEYFCHLVALQHPKPQEVLILGGGIEGLIGEMEKYQPRRIDYVELNPSMMREVTKYLPDKMRASLAERNVHIIFADPRQYLKKSGSYDLILVGMPEPASGQANRFYTQEFYEQCARCLNPGGILGFRLQTAENLWSVPLARRNTSIFRALQAVFPHVLFLPGNTNIVTASRLPLPRAPEVMAQRLQALGISTRLISANYIKYLFTNDRFSEIGNLLKKEQAQPNTDIRPVCYQYTFMIWLSKFFPRAAVVDLSALATNIFFKPPLSLLLWIVLPIIFLLARLHPTLRRATLVAAAAFIGMVLETVLILYYQVKHGVLYQDIGLLLASFMTGLSAGAMIVNHLISKRQGGKQKFVRIIGFVLVGGFCLLCAATGMILDASAPAGLLTTLLFLVITGCLVAGAFAYASLYDVEDQRGIISPLYFADLMGGCIGAVAGSLILIPLAGMDVTAWGMLLVSAFSIFLL
jgi:spermidine synthase